ncbi:MAG: PepSY-like domain-containing protein [Bacteroidota bacterium]|nr:PepSY-like domain-containing protein [Bacteroidota bacterium]
MKTFVMTLAVIIATSIVATAQRTSKIPQSVKESFAVKFPGTRVKKWNKVKENYTAIFESQNKKQKVTFTLDGKWVKTETKIKWKDIPESIKTAFAKSKYLSWKKNEIIVIDMPENSKLFVIEVDNESEFHGEDYVLKDDYSLFFTPDGKLIKEEKHC